MRIFVHDYAGHPFQIELSRELAARGHDVLHAYCASLVTTPHGALNPSPDDPDSLVIKPLSLGEPLEKFKFIKRFRQENAYGDLAAAQIRSFAPDVVLSGNAPLDAQKRVLKASRSVGSRFVYWVQDLVGIATQRLLRRRWMGLGAMIGMHYARLERTLLQQSDHSVVISSDFLPVLESFGIGTEAVTVIENWAPLGEVAPQPRDNRWSTEKGFGASLRFLYSGTLGLKHNPDLLLQLALHIPEAAVIVVSQGLGADWLLEQKTMQEVSNLHVLPFQPYEQLPEVLATGDILVAILEPEADVFSVPSKVLTYLCARRPVLLAVPAKNLAARIVERNAAGVVVSPTDTQGFLDGARTLASNPESLESMAGNARGYAERNFDIDTIADRFEQVLTPPTQTKTEP
jgi:glycosyltransferase involved in cell wall biosynthesis